MTENTSIRTGQMIASFIALFFIWMISLISSRASIRVRVQPADALEIPKFLYLKAGTGNAWAGHIKVSGWSQWTVYVREFSVIGNFGFVLATGSTRKHLRYRRDRWVDSVRCVERRDRAIDRHAWTSSTFLISVSLYKTTFTTIDLWDNSATLSHLCEGTGNPWAGHRRVRACSTVETNPRELSIVGNLGRTLPTGSAIPRGRNT